MKKITKQRNEDFTQRDVNDLEKFADRILKSMVLMWSLPNILLIDLMTQETVQR